MLLCPVFIPCQLPKYTQAHAHMNAQISPLPALPYCAANCLSSHPAAALICTTNRPQHTHTLSRLLCPFVFICLSPPLPYQSLSISHFFLSFPKFLFSLSNAMFGFPQHTSVPSVLVVPAQNNIHCFNSTVTHLYISHGSVCF